MYLSSSPPIDALATAANQLDLDLDLDLWWGSSPGSKLQPHVDNDGERL